MLPVFPAHAALVAYNLSGSAQSIQADLAALPAAHVVAIQQWSMDQWAAPAVLSPMTALARLHLSYQIQLSRGSGLEQILQPLVQLRHLSAKSCQLAAVPAPLSGCTQLTRLDLSDNFLIGGWQHLQPLAQLQHLSLGCTAKLPVSQPLPTQLTRLDLLHCSNVPAGSRQLTALRLLRHLDLSECRLTDVPSAVSTLTTLTGLSLGHNRLRPPGGFDHLRPLTRLQSLGLHWNGLAEVPAAISALTSLQHLSLGHPPGGWQHLRPLAQLLHLGAFKYLDVDTPESHLLVASEAAANLHPAAVQRMLAEPDGDLHVLLDMLARRGLPRPV